jgi:hypothetical protein
MSDSKIPFRRELTLLLLGAALALVGSYCNALLSNKMEKENWEQRTQFEAEQKILGERIKLVERTAQIMNKIDYLELNYLIESGKTDLAKIGAGKLEDIIDHRKIVAELNSEFLTVVSLNNIYFGPQVREAQKKLFDATNNETPWWRTDENLRDNYANAVFSEISYGLNEYNK